jgi:hypothetical protein
VLTPATKLQILNHDEEGAEICGWQASIDYFCGENGTVDMDENPKDPAPHCA